MDLTAACFLAVGTAGLAGTWAVTAMRSGRLRRQAAWGEARALVDAARALGAASDPLAVMPVVLAGLGQALGCARLELHAIHTADGGSSPLSSLRQAWAASGMPDRAAEPSLRDRPWHPGRTRWLCELTAGRPVVATARDLDAGLLGELGGCGAIVLAPVVVAGRLWGCLACFDRAARRRNAGDCTQLQLGAEIIATAIASTQVASQLIAARADAVAGDRAKREFLANISHEVRTPLNGVLGMTGLLLDTPLDARQREYAQVTRTSAENLLAQLNDMLDLAKAEGDGAQRAELARIDPVRLAEDVVAMLAERAHAKGLEIAVHPAEDLPRSVAGDATRLRQVLGNLLGNAIKFTGRGHVIVHVDWDEEAGGTLTYAVHDTGIGLDEAAQARLFGLFTQADSSSTRRYGGTGLGLAICKRLVAIMGGTVTCRSSLGSGSVFTVRVPSPKGSTVAGSRTSLVSSSLLGARVLVVEADAAARSAIAAVCRRIGLVAEETSGCLEAVALLSAPGALPPRLVLVSASLPGVSDLPKLLAHNGPPCVLLAPIARRPLRAEVVRLGFAACLVKPPRTLRLVELAARVLSQREDESGEDTVTPNKRFLRVLVVENDTINQQLAKAVLEQDGLRCDIAADGHEAIDALARVSYDAVLMDLLMPVMDGFACAREIRRLERERGQPPIPILAVSALDQADTAERCRAAGIDGQIDKPFEPRHLRRILRKLLSARGAAPGPPPGALPLDPA